MICSLLSHLLTPHPRSSSSVLLGLLSNLILSLGAKSGTCCDSGEVQEKIRGGKRGKGEKNKANYEILLGNMENLIIPFPIQP